MQVLNNSKGYPSFLHRWYSRAVTITLTDWAKASTTKEALRAIQKCRKLKAAMIRPLRGGRAREVEQKLYVSKVNQSTNMH